MLNSTVIRKRNLHFSAVIMFLSMLFSPLSAFAFSNGANAQNAVGQLGVDGNPSYTRSAANNDTRASGISSANDTAIDEAGHRLFVSDGGNHRILVFNLNTSNVLVDYSADYVLGQSDLISNAASTASQSTLNAPWGIDFDATGNRLFVADYSNHRVLVFDVASITNGENAVNVLGQANYAGSGADITQATLNGPSDVDLDETNNRLFVTDLGNSRIMVFNVAAISNGENAVNVLGQADFESSSTATTQGGLSQPNSSIYVSNGDRLFVADTQNNRVMVFNVAAISDGENAVNVLGQEDFVTSSSPVPLQDKLSAPSGMAYDSTSKYLFVADTSNIRVMIFDVDAISNGEDAVNVLGQNSFTASTVATSQAGFSSSPYSVTLDNTNDRVFVADPGNNRVMIFDISTIGDGENAVNVLGQTDITISEPVYTGSDVNNGLFGSEFYGPSGMAIDLTDHRLFVSDVNNNRVLVFNLNTSNVLIDYTADYVLGQTTLRKHASATTQSGLNGPNGLSFDDANDRLFVTDNGNNRVMVFNVATISNGEAAVNVLGQSLFSTSAAAATQKGMDNPKDVEYDSVNNKLYVADMNNYRVKIYDVTDISDGENAANVLGQSDHVTGTPPESPTQSEINGPAGLVFDASNSRLFVSDYGYGRVMVFDLTVINDGEDAANVLGQANFTSYSGEASQSKLTAPSELEYEGVNNQLFVADLNHNRIMVFNVATISDGEIAANVLGQAGFTTTDTGTSQSLLGGNASSLTYNSSNDVLWVADYNNNRALEFDVSPGGGEGVPEFSTWVYLFTFAAAGWYLLRNINNQPSLT